MCDWGICGCCVMTSAGRTCEARKLSEETSFFDSPHHTRSFRMTQWDTHWKRTSDKLNMIAGFWA
uniref:Uncharacterized protein n=1 Tax=Anguilla anguilla TaxID=7936 RepID=A0A0E9S8U3_ANGAN